MMGGLRQIFAVTLMNVRNVPERPGMSLVVVIGIAGVVAVLVSVLSMAQGFKYTLASTGRPDRVILLRSGSDAELASSIARDQVQMLANLEGIARDGQGRPLASAEAVVVADLPRKGSNDRSNVPFRGVQPAAFALRDEFRLIEGRHFGQGVREVIVGKKAAQEFAGLSVGSRIEYRDSDWTVVGVFSTGGDVSATPWPPS
ncbi:MAG: ABC-type antimicrobial peptide transport system [Proteobacteria bacterium]|nr:ABC-type antimicrobial peptide transport system [Pseudomonadota bacterium]